jgi:epoxide hydrolase 4
MTSPDTHVRFARRNTNGITLHVAEAGPESGQLLILLHGFPEFWYGWRRQIPALAGSGYWVVAPDQRGYNLSDKPRGIAAYDLDRLAADITGLADSAGRRRFSIVGHDWGAVVGWWIASRHPDRVERLAALNAPHPVIWRRAMRDDPAQRRRSWYVHAFRTPWLPEFMLRRQNFEALAQAVRDTRRADVNSEADLAVYRAAWSKPGALTAMVNWYRALLRKDLLTEPLPHIKPRTLIIWGTGDKFVIQHLAENSSALCMQGSVSYLNAATHWVQHDEPDRVNALLLEFLQ